MPRGVATQEAPLQGGTTGVPNLKVCVLDVGTRNVSSITVKVTARLRVLLVALGRRNHTPIVSSYLIRLVLGSAYVIGIDPDY